MSFIGDFGSCIGESKVSGMECNNNELQWLHYLYSGTLEWSNVEVLFSQERWEKSLVTSLQSIYQTYIQPINMIVKLLKDMVNHLCLVCHLLLM